MNQSVLSVVIEVRWYFSFIIYSVLCNIQENYKYILESFQVIFWSKQVLFFYFLAETGHFKSFLGRNMSFQVILSAKKMSIWVIFNHDRSEW